MSQLSKYLDEESMDPTRERTCTFAGSAHRKSGLSMPAMTTEIGLSAASVGQLIKCAEAEKRPRLNVLRSMGIKI